VRARADWSRFLLVELTGTGEAILWRYDGAWTALGWGSVPLAAGSTHVLGATAVGSVVGVRWDGVDLFAATDVVDAAATSAGIYVGTGDPADRPTLDNFGAAAGTPSGLTPPSCDALAPTPAVGASDSFDRTGCGGALGRADSGQVWETAPDSAWALCANTRACPLAPADGESWARLDTQLVDQRVSAIVAPRPGADGMAGLFARGSADWVSDQVWVGLDATGHLEVWVLADGGWGDGAAGAADTGLDASTSRTLTVSVVGTALRVYVDGALAIGPVAVPTAPPGATMAGIYAATTDPSSTSWPQFESFTVTNGPA
jgi:hypothetical protein